MDTQPDHLTDTPTWRELTTRAEVAAALLDLYRTRGSNRYDEAVTQAEHALQCGALAMANRASDALIVAALLHDVGHLLMVRAQSGGAGAGGGPDRDLRHEEVGARFLARWFDGDVTLPIRLHVSAKRALCALEPSYHDGLSPASAHSLQLQGGPMTPGGLDRFRAEPHAGEAMALRRWDDGAKAPGAPTPTLTVFADLIADVMRRP